MYIPDAMGSYLLSASCRSFAIVTAQSGKLDGSSCRDKQGSDYKKFSWSCNPLTCR